MSETGRVSGIILAYNGAAYTRACLKSVLGLTYRPLELVLVNNGSSDQTAELLEKFQPTAAETGIDTQILDFSENRGAVEARNLAMERSRGEYVLFLDNDVMVRSTDIIEQMTDYLSRHPHVGAVGPKLVYPLRPHLVQSAGGVTTCEGMTYLIGRGQARDRPELNVIMPRDWLITACMMVPAAVVDEVGEFDMTFHPYYFEDVDYCCRIRVKGYELMYLPSAEMYHFENASSQSTAPRAMSRLVSRNRRVFWRKWRHLFEDAISMDDVPWMWREMPRARPEDIHRAQTVRGDCTRISSPVSSRS